MEVILHGLNLLGHTQVAGQIRDRWSGLLELIGAKQEPMYRKACPKGLLEQAAVRALEGTRAIGCRLADSFSMKLG